MRKRIIVQGTQGIIFPTEGLLDLENSVQPELTSDASHPIESGLAILSFTIIIAS